MCGEPRSHRGGRATTDLPDTISHCHLPPCTQAGTATFEFIKGQYPSGNLSLQAEVVQTSGVSDGRVLSFLEVRWWWRPAGQAQRAGTAEGSPTGCAGMRLLPSRRGIYLQQLAACGYVNPPSLPCAERLTDLPEPPLA